MTISIIIPCYQTPLSQIYECLASIAAQNVVLDAVEVILSQDGDCRDLSELISRFPEIDLRLLIATDNMGISHARNLAIQDARGDFVLLLDADDAIEPNCLSAFFEAIEATAGTCALYFSNAYKTSTDIANVVRKIDSTHFFNLHQEIGREWDNPIFHSIFVGHCLVIRRDVLCEVGGFDESFRCAEITNLVLRLFYHGCRIQHLPMYLYRYRDNPRGLSKQNNINRMRERSIAEYFQKTLKISVEDIRCIGRIAPYFHTHFMLRADGREMRLPYVDYDAMALLSDSRMLRQSSNRQYW